MVTIDIIKHSASIEWNAQHADGAIPAGRLHLHTEDELAENREARDGAVIALKRLAALLRESGLQVTVITHNQHDELLGEAVSA